MRRKRESIYNTSMLTVLLDDNDVYRLDGKYPQIGYGSEGTMYKYNSRLAFKIFDNTADDVLVKKFKKLEELSKLKDESFCFPIGLVGYKKSKKKEGYFTDLVVTEGRCKDFNYLYYELQLLKDTRKALCYIQKADSAIQRIHKKGVIIGDINGNNIMIDKDGNPRFVDTDNYSYGDFGFDLEPARIHWLERAFNKSFPLIDSDKYSYALLCMNLLMPEVGFLNNQNEEFFKKIINSIDTDKETKEGLRLILSDAFDKPYITEVITEDNIDHIKIKQK